LGFLFDKIVEVREKTLLNLAFISTSYKFSTELNYFDIFVVRNTSLFTPKAKG